VRKRYVLNGSKGNKNRAQSRQWFRQTNSSSPDAKLLCGPRSSSMCFQRAIAANCVAAYTIQLIQMARPKTPVGSKEVSSYKKGDKVWVYYDGTASIGPCLRQVLTAKQLSGRKARSKARRAPLEMRSAIRWREIARQMSLIHSVCQI
jgi:hypothetical protein